MALRSAHGTAATLGAAAVLETLPADELPDGMPAHADDESRTAAEERGRFKKGNRRSVMGGRARKGKPRLVERVSLTAPGVELPTAPYHAAAKGFAAETRRTLARYVGGGQLDAHTGYLVTAAARAAKWAAYFSDLAERLPEGTKEQRDTVTAALNADEKASSHLRNAHEYAARMATAREATERLEGSEASWLAAIERQNAETNDHE